MGDTIMNKKQTRCGLLLLAAATLSPISAHGGSGWAGFGGGLAAGTLLGVATSRPAETKGVYANAPQQQAPAPSSNGRSARSRSLERKMKNMQDKMDAMDAKISKAQEEL